MNYFKDFGSIEKIEEFIKATDALHGKSQFNKDKLPDQYADIIKKYTEETDKMYRKFDYDTALYEILNNIPDKETSVVKLIKYQNELFGYVTYKNPKFKNTGLVLSMDTKYSPRVDVYMLDSGEVMTYKVAKALYQKNPFDPNSIIKFYSEERQKSKKVDGEWVKLPEKELWITNYIIKNTDL
jgi:hypothetical protein